MKDAPKQIDEADALTVYPVTDNVTTSDVTVEQGDEVFKTTLYLLPSMEFVNEENDNVDDVAPETFEPLTLDQLFPPSVLTCHWYDKVLPLPDALIVIVPEVALEQTVKSVGCALIVGAAYTVNKAALLLIDPLFNEQRYLYVFEVTVKPVRDNDEFVSPEISDQVDPPSVETCH